MDKRIQKSKETNEGNRCFSGESNQRTCSPKKAGRKPKEEEPGINNIGDLLSAVLHYIPLFITWLSEVEDPRRIDRIIHLPEVIILITILERLCGTDSRTKITLHNKNKIFKENLEILLKRKLEYLPHGDTVNYFFENLHPNELDKILVKMIHALRKKKILKIFKYKNHYLLAIDGVHLKTSKQPLPNSLKFKLKDGSIEYRQYALEAKLVSPAGPVFSIGSTFIGEDDLPSETSEIKTDAEGKIIEYPKQDCELKAFKRLIEEIYINYPQWNFVLLLDALYMSKSVIEIANKYNWWYAIALKKGSVPVLYESAMQAIKKDYRTRIKNSDGTVLEWANGVIWNNGDKEYRINVIGTEKVNNDGWAFLYATNIFINKNEAQILQDEVCRERWKIENQGFREQKHCGLELEKAFGTRKHAALNYYKIVQITHLIRVLIFYSNIFRTLQRIDNKGIIKETIQKPMLEFFKTIKHFVNEFARSIFSYKLTLRNKEFQRLEFAVPYS